MIDNIMIDLETMGNGPNAAICAIGAVAFGIKDNNIADTFYNKISLESSVKAGGIIDVSTILWWMKQSNEARNDIIFGQTPLFEVLMAFTDWMNRTTEPKQVKVWGNGSDFDNVILASAYKNLNQPIPWKFYNNRCYRTLKNLYPELKMNYTGTKHNALADAENQTKHLLDIFTIKEFV